jgi:hypothetical protein
MQAQALVETQTPVLRVLRVIRMVDLEVAPQLQVAQLQVAQQPADLHLVE